MTPRAGSDRARRAAIRLLRWYPIRWRARYEREMKALLEEMPVGWRQVANLAGTAVREWLSPRAVGWPSPAAAARVRFFRLGIFLATALTIDLAARLIASRLVAWQLTIPVTFRPRDALLLTLIPLIRLALAPAIGLETLQQSRQPGVRPNRWAGFLSDGELVAWLLLFVPFVIARYAVAMNSADLESVFESYLDVFFIWGWTAMFVQASKRTQRLRAVERAMLRRPLRTLNSTRVSA